MTAGVGGVACATAALGPARHWPVVVAGLLDEVPAPIGFLGAAAGGVFLVALGPIVVPNGLIS